MSTHPSSAEGRTGLIGVFMVAASILGCAGKPPVETLSNADTAVNQAMTAQAPKYAPLELQRALDEVSRAKRAMADKDYQKARWLAEKALVDAQVAEAVAQSANAKQTAQEARKIIDTLRQEAETQGRGTLGTGASQGGTGNVEAR